MFAWYDIFKQWPMKKPIDPDELAALASLFDYTRPDYEGILRAWTREDNNFSYALVRALREKRMDLGMLKLCKVAEQILHAMQGAAANARQVYIPKDRVKVRNSPPKHWLADPFHALVRAERESELF